MILGELASLIRSKNAGPFTLTFDIMFDEPGRYRRVLDSGVVTVETFAVLYGCAVEQVSFYQLDNALAFKFSIPRPITQGDLGDCDSHGGQQYVPLMTIDIP